MKKDIEWLKTEIKKMFQDVVSGEIGLNAEMSLFKVYGLVKELDEPETLSEEWIENHTASADTISYYSDESVPVVKVIKLKNLLVPKQEITFEQVHDKLREESILSEKSFDYYWNCINDNVEIDEPGSIFVAKQDKPVIPKFIANWFESYRKKTLVELITDAVYSPYEDSKRFRRWFHEKMGFESNYSEFLSRIWLDGYEVEEEQKYQVIIRDGEYIRLYLCKHGDNVIIGTNDNYIEKCPEVTYLTEKEIKDYDERYWAFAEEVAE